MASYQVLVALAMCGRKASWPAVNVPLFLFLSLFRMYVKHGCAEA
jgi:hypothetical protein